MARIVPNLTCSLALVCVLVAVLVSRASAQEAQLQITSVVSDNWPALEATVTVIDASGEPVVGLTADSFDATIDGQPAPVEAITTISDPSIGIAVVLVFDVSGSMEGAPLEGAKAAGKALVAGLGPADRAAVLSFSDQVTSVQGFTGDKGALDGSIDALVAGGNTDLYAAVQQGAELAREGGLPRQAVVLLSDGVDFGVTPTVSREGSLAAADESGAIFMTVGLGPDVDSDYLSSLAGVGSGQFLVTPDPGELVQVYTTVGGILRQQYVLTLDASGVGASADGSTLTVAADIGGIIVETSSELTIPGLTSTPAATPGATASPTASPEPAPTAAPGAGNVAEEGGGSSSPLPWILLAGVAGVATAGGLGVYSLSRRRAAAARADDEGSIREPVRDVRPVVFPEISRAAVETASAWLEQADGARMPLSSAPITVGFAPDCSVCLPGDANRPERVRIWRRDGRYMLHNLSRIGEVLVGGKPASWVILEDGDEIALSGVRLTFREPDGGKF